MKRFLIMIKLFLKTPDIVIPFSILVACCNVFLFKLTTGFVANASNQSAINDAIYYFGDINLLCFLLFLFWIFISFEFMRKVKETHTEELLNTYGRSGKLVCLEQMCVLVLVAALLAINISVYYIVACVSLRVSDQLTGEAIRLLAVNIWCLSFGAIGMGCVLAKIKKRFFGYVTMLAILFLILPNTVDFFGMLQQDYHIPVFFVRDLICLIPPDMSAVNDTLYGFPTEAYRMAAMGFWVVFALLLFTWEFYKNIPKRRFISLAVLVGLSGLLLYQAEVKGSVLLMNDHPEASLNEIVDYYIKHEAKDEAANFEITEYNIIMTMGKELEAEVIMALRSPDRMSCYRFTLYHGYKIKEVTDGVGTPLDYSREGDYLEIQSQGDSLPEIRIAYKGHSSSFYANKKACFLPGFFPYYPRAGYRMIYDINKRTYVSHRDEKTKFHVTVDKDHIFSNLRKDGKTFKGVAENLILVNGYYKETKSESKRMITYPLSENEEQGIKERLEQLPAELEELQSFLGIPELETSFPELIVTVPGSLAMASSVQKYFSYEDYALVSSNTGAYDILEEEMLESGMVTKEKKLLFDMFFSMHIEADTDVDILGLWKEEEGFTGYETKEMELSDFFVEKIRKYGIQYVSSEIMRYLWDENNHMDSLEFIKKLEKGSKWMLKVKHVNKNFGKRKVLDDICLELENGCYGLLGPNGAGKTTLLRCILKLYPLKEGEICTNNKDIGYLPQKFGVFQELTVYDILYYFSTLKKVPKEERDGEIDRVLSLVNLEDRKKERMSRLSGGMLRRVGIAQAILGDPEVLFFDEPTAGLDPEERARFKRLVKKIMEGKIVIISTHIVEDVESLCDRVIIMNQGKILENVTVDAACQFAGSEANANLEAGYLARIQGD